MSQYIDYTVEEEDLNTFNNSVSPSNNTNSPSRGFRTPKAKTPKGDRFIPSREQDLDIGHFNLTKENSNPNYEMSPSKMQYSTALENSLLDGKTQSKILSFKAKAPAPKSHQNSLHCLYSHNKINDTVPKKTYRQIPQAPEKILDAPEMVDDYYLNLLDWSATNILAVALGKTVYLWNATTSDITQLCEMSGDDNIVTSVSWTKEGNCLAVGNNNNTVQLWDVSKGKRVRELKGHQSRVGALAWNGFMLSSGSRDTSIINHDVRIANNRVATWSNHTMEVCGLRWNHDGTQLASGGNDNQLNIWNVNNSSNAPEFSLTHHTAAVRALAWCPFQPNLLASGGGTADRTIRFWNTNTGACLNTVNTNSQVCQLMWSTNYKEIVSSHGYSQNQLTVWKYPSMEKVSELTGHQSRALHLALSPDGETVVSGSCDETLRFWRIFEKEAKATGTTAQAARKAKEANVLRNMNTMIR